MNIQLNEDAIVVFVGAMGTGKSTFAQKHFMKHHVVESDYIREQLTSDFKNQDFNDATFEIFFSTIEARAKAGLLTVADSTGSGSVLEKVKDIAKKYERQLVCIKFPHLDDSQITKERMQHRMKYIHAYYRQVERINKTPIPKQYQLFELDDIDNVSVTFNKSSDLYELSPDYKYVVIPDLHGEHWVLEHYVEEFQDHPHVKFICLGDIVDRGTSSYKTFRLVKKLIDEGNMFHVISNHDNKFYRWLKKWKDNPYVEYHPSVNTDPPSYGMKIAHGLDKTIREFFSLCHEKQKEYADEFIEYYESASPYLYLDEEDTGSVYYFSHAGLSERSTKNLTLKKGDYAALMYETLSDIDYAAELFKHMEDKYIHIVLGHDYIENPNDRIIEDQFQRITIHKCDVGLGKELFKSINDIPRFKLI